MGGCGVWRVFFARTRPAVPLPPPPPPAPHLVYARQSFHVSTPVSSSTQRPASAASTGGTPSASPPTHSTTAPAMVAAIVASSLESGPIAFKRAAAALGASGVRVTDGGCSLYASAGASARPTSAGSDAATNQVVHAPGMTTPSSAASFMQSRFWGGRGAAVVWCGRGASARAGGRAPSLQPPPPPSHLRCGREEEGGRVDRPLKLGLDEEGAQLGARGVVWKERRGGRRARAAAAPPPSPPRPRSLGSDPAPRASESMMGMNTPPARAVVDGMAGARHASAAARP